MNNSAPMRNCPVRVQGNLNWGIIQSSGDPFFCAANHLCNLSKGHSEEHFVEIIMLVLLLGGAKPFVQFR